MSKILSHKTIKPGIRVRCIYKASQRYGYTGIIQRANIDDILIQWDDGYTDLTNWANPGSFELIEDNDSFEVNLTFCQKCGCYYSSPCQNHSEFNNKAAFVR